MTETTEKHTRKRKKLGSYKVELPRLVQDDFKKYEASFLAAYGDNKVTRRILDSMAFIMSMITTGLVTDHRNRELATNSKPAPIKYWHCHLMSTLLSKIFGTRYNEIIELLIAAGFIHRSDFYVVGGEGHSGISKAFWFAKKYQRYISMYLNTRSERRYSDESVVVKGSMVKYEITSPTILRHWYEFLKERKEQSLNDGVVKGCYDNLLHFSIDEELADKVISEMRSEGKMTEKKEIIERQKIQRFNDMHDDPLALYVIRDRYGRVHTNTTALKKEIRHSALKCDGKDVCEVDIKSSQAAFLVPVFRRYCDSVCNGVVSSEDSFLSYTPFWHKDDDNVLDYMRMVTWEVERYTKLVSDRKIYEFFQEKLAERMGRAVTRNEAKKAFLSFLFAPTEFKEEKDPVRTQVKNVWWYEFPHLRLVLQHLKAHCHAALAYELQKIESSFVFDTVIPRITAEIGCNYCTVHDSIIVPVEFGDKVKQIIDEELENADIPTVTEAEYMVNLIDCDMNTDPDELIDEMVIRNADYDEEMRNVI